MGGETELFVDFSNFSLNWSWGHHVVTYIAVWILAVYIKDAVGDTNCKKHAWTFCTVQSTLHASDAYIVLNTQQRFHHRIDGGSTKSMSRKHKEEAVLYVFCTIIICFCCLLAPLCLKLDVVLLYAIKISNKLSKLNSVLNWLYTILHLCVQAIFYIILFSKRYCFNYQDSSSYYISNWKTLSAQQRHQNAGLHVIQI